MTGEYHADDERFTLASTDYGFRLPPRQGALGGTSSSPFAPKSVSGERAYADYDTFSALAWADWSGGMGQEKATDATMYYTAYNVDARSGQLIIGPQTTTATSPTMPSIATVYDTWLDFGAASTFTGYATKWVAPVDATGNALYRVWVALKALRAVAEITVKLYDDSAGLPGSVLATATLSETDLTTYGQWAAAVFTSPYTLTGGTTYWLCVEYAGSSTAYLWTQTDASAITLRAVLQSGSWVAAGAWTPAIWADVPAVRPDSPPRFFIGSGEDAIVRMWCYAGRALYYMNSSGAPAPVGVSTGGATKLLTADILDAAWYQSSAATYPSLYLALGETVPIEAFDGNLADIQWQTQSGNYAIALCVHDNLLFYAYERNKIDAFNGSTWHSTASTPASPAAVGDRTYPIRNLISWNGYLWAGKADGLYRITNPVGYPVTGTLTTTKVLDFLSVADDHNFELMVVHNGDLYFSIGTGLLKYTTGDVLTAISPDAGLNIAAEKRSYYRAAVSSLNTLWVLAEAAVDGYSALLAYTEGHWHPVRAFDNVLAAMTRSIALEPGWYGDLPRLWFGMGLRVAYVEMPTNTQRRWLWADATYEATGYLLTSWFDGNIRTIEKDWVQVELDVRGVGAVASGCPYVTVFWRPDEATAWVSLGNIETDGLSTLTFPVNSYSTKCQLKVTLTANTATFGGAVAYAATPRVEAVVLKYLERPADLRTYTRTYYLADRLVRRNGVLVNESLAEQLAHLRTLRQSPEPLTWYAWWGTSYTVHMVDYTWSEARNETIDGRDKGGLYVTLRLVEL